MIHVGCPKLESSYCHIRSGWWFHDVSCVFPSSQIRCCTSLSAPWRFPGAHGVPLRRREAAAGRVSFFLVAVFWRLGCWVNINGHYFFARYDPWKWCFFGPQTSIMKKISHCFASEDLEHWGCNGGMVQWWFDDDVFWEYWCLPFPPSYQVGKLPSSKNRWLLGSTCWFKRCFITIKSLDLL